MYVATDFADIQFSTVTFTHIPQIYMLELHECTLLEYLHIHTYCMCSPPVHMVLYSNWLLMCLAPLCDNHMHVCM